MPLNSKQKRELMQEVIRYARGGRSTKRFRRLGQIFGPLGELVGMVADVFAGGRTPTRRDIDDAIELLTRSGYQVKPPEMGGTIPPVRQVPQAGGPPRQPAPPPLRVRGRETAEPWPEETTIRTLPTRVRGAVEMPGEGFSPDIFTPESSNVYSMQYDYKEGLLYVTYRAAGKPESYKTMTNSCTGEEYKVGVRPNAPGPVYAYGGAGRRIPEGMFESFAGANSKGQWVWQNLRVCGSQHQHQYPYSLTSVPTGPGGETYVPRKATGRGLRVRHVPQVGQGRRGSTRSTLPERIRQ